jgi:hypothetical protein
MEENYLATHQKSKCKVSPKKYEKLISLNYYKKNHNILNLRLMDSTQLNKVLKKYHLPKEIRNKFLEELVDGNSFIFLMTEKLGLENLVSYMNFNQEQIKLLKRFYSHIYRFRKLYSKEFNSDEIPIF